MASKLISFEEKEAILKSVIVDITMGLSDIKSICKKNGIHHQSLYEWFKMSEFKHYREIYNTAKWEADERQLLELTSLAKVKLIDKIEEGNILAIKIALEMPASKREVKLNIINKLSDRLDELQLEKGDYLNIIKVLKEIERD